MVTLVAMTAAMSLAGEVEAAPSLPVPDVELGAVQENEYCTSGLLAFATCGLRIVHDLIW